MKSGNFNVSNNQRTSNSQRTSIDRMSSLDSNHDTTIKTEKGTYKKVNYRFNCSFGNFVGRLITAPVHLLLYAVGATKLQTLAAKKIAAKIGVSGKVGGATRTAFKNITGYGIKFAEPTFNSAFKNAFKSAYVSTATSVKMVAYLIRGRGLKQSFRSAKIK